MDTRFQMMAPAEQLHLTMSWVYDSGLTTTSGGNISVRESNGNIWITPSGIDKGSLTPRDMICVKPDGSTEGNHKPSSELPSHQSIYKKRPDINAIIHAHPPALVSFSIVRQKPDTDVIPQAKSICGNVGYAPYRLPGSQELGDSIATEFEKGYNSVIMENHGTVVGGENLDEAFQRFETLEFCARTIIKANEIGTHRRLTEKQAKLYEDYRSPIPETENFDYPADERALRSAICKFVERACRQNLMISTYGTVSARWRGSDFLITPTGINRKRVTPADIVQIRDGRAEAGKSPSRATKLHADIYKKHAHINSIITAQPPNVSAFCISGQDFDTHTIPESYVFLRNIPMVPFGSQLSDSHVILETLSEKNPVLLVENDAVMVTGSSILEAFDRLEVAEFSARSLVNTSPLGDVVPIGEKEIKKLDEITSS